MMRKNMGMRQAVAFMRDNEIFRRLEKVTSVASLTPEELRSYEADVKNYTALPFCNSHSGAMSAPFDQKTVFKTPNS
ncbi:MAG: hypothetical protein K2L00_00705 [Muribaculaceae bacterium]|nr:hypothetical protein [Muribaculaceae bacterium]